MENCSLFYWCLLPWLHHLNNLNLFPLPFFTSVFQVVMLQIAFYCYLIEFSFNNFVLCQMVFQSYVYTFHLLLCLRVSKFLLRKLWFLWCVYHTLTKVMLTFIYSSPLVSFQLYLSKNTTLLNFMSTIESYIFGSFSSELHKELV